MKPNSFLKDNDELRGVINSGHARDGQVIRLVGENHEPRVFSTWCPVAIAAIGGLPGTIEDRSVIIQMRRRRSDERVARFRVDRVGAQQELGRKAARWAADSAGALRDADPVVPTELNDRAADNWRPLLAIADRAGGQWPEKARRAALELSAVKAGEADTMRTLLLADIRGVFAEKRVDRLKSETACNGSQRDGRSAMADFRQGQMDDAGGHRAAAQTVRDQSGDGPIWRGNCEGLPSFGVRGCLRQVPPLRRRNPVTNE